MSRSPAALFRTTHVVALVLCAVFLPWSTAFLSMAQMLLVVNWFAAGVHGGTMRGRLKGAFADAPSLVFLSFFGLHLLGLLWTQDMEWGLDLVRIIVPVLSFGAVLAGSQRLSVPEFRAIMLLGAWSVVASSIFGALFSGAVPGDYRTPSMFISHIRLVLLLCLAIVVFVWNMQRPALWVRVLYGIAILWCLYFINRLGSLQGYVILAVLAAAWWWIKAAHLRPLVRWSARAALVLVPACLIALVALELQGRMILPAADLPFREPRSAGGELYAHDLHDPQQENGTHVWTHIAWQELRRTWSLRSDRSLDTPDERGHPLWATAVRYLASKGLTKDSVGVMALNDADVRAIERGVANVMEGRRNTLRERFEEVLFELQLYGNKGIASGHSVAMRLEFWRTGWSIAKANAVVGVGTGDTQLAFNEAYASMGSTLAPEWRLRAHNQYLTLWISFGVLGLLWSLFAWCWPAWRSRAFREPLFLAWAVIFAISCFTDDTIETQAGATFFALYYALFVFAAPRAAVITPAAPERAGPAPR